MLALIEDESEKAEALRSALIDLGIDQNKLFEYNNVRDAVLAIIAQDFRLIVLDVSLPTFSPEGMAGSAGRAQQQSGGLEVLRALKARKKTTPIIIVTQYPDIIFEGRSVDLALVPKHVSERYGQVVVDAILFREAEPDSWLRRFGDAVRRVECGSW
jgi:CheY-like chemotaxis protein